MSNAEYDKMQAQENEVTEGIEKLTKAEQYQKLIKQDLGKLDSEKAPMIIGTASCTAS